MPPASTPPHVVVVGGGIAGLAAAAAVRRERPDVAVTVLESSPVIGGKLARAEVGGVTVDVGAEAMLNRRPEAVALARAAGLEADLVHPATISANLWTRDRLQPMPRTMMGVPVETRALSESGVLSKAGLARVAMDSVLPATRLDGRDVSIGWLVEERFGREVVDRLVEPLLGGVYAGHARELSARAAVPQVVALLDRDRSMMRAAAAASSGPTSDIPVFAGIRGGVGRLADAVASTSGATVRTDATVRDLARAAGGGWNLVVGSTRDAEVVRADAVVLAAPARPTGRLLSDVAPDAALELARIDYASMAVITLAFRASDLPATTGSGFLVPPVDGRSIKAATFSFAKWAWVTDAGTAPGGDGVLLLRCSIGRHREESVLQVEDAELVETALADLGDAIGLTARPVDSHVQRWGGALPQYAVGHLDRVHVHPDRRRSPARPRGLRCGIRRARHPGVHRLRRAGGDPGPLRVGARGRMSDMSETVKRPQQGKAAKELNESIRYTMWSVFRLRDVIGDADRAREANEVEKLLEALEAEDVRTRGMYDVAGLRADADVMVWWHAETADALQDAYHRFRRTTFGARLDPVWSQMALHRPAEFNKSHIPAFLADEEARAYVCVYPFVRSYEWYLLEDSERRRMLSEHGMMARDYADVRANTVASFALGDYEWLLAFEADELHRIVDLMRHLRASDARRHVREEVPFYTGRRRSPTELVTDLP